MLVEWELWGGWLKPQASELEIYSTDILNIEYYLKESEENNVGGHGMQNGLQKGQKLM